MKERNPFLCRALSACRVPTQSLLLPQHRAREVPASSWLMAWLGRANNVCLPLDGVPWFKREAATAGPGGSHGQEDLD